MISGNYLINYKGAVVLISHDRYFLNKIVGKVIEIDNHKATVFMGSYTDYSQKKQMLRNSLMHAYLNQQREIKHQEQMVGRLIQKNDIRAHQKNFSQGHPGLLPTRRFATA